MEPWMIVLFVLGIITWIIHLYYKVEELKAELQKRNFTISTLMQRAKALDGAIVNCCGLAIKLRKLLSFLEENKIEHPFPNFKEGLTTKEILTEKKLVEKIANGYKTTKA